MNDDQIEAEYLKNQITLVLAALHPKTPDEFMEGPDGEKQLSDKDKTVLKPLIDQVVSNLCELEDSPFFGQDEDIVAEKFEQSMQLFLREYNQNQLSLAAARRAEKLPASSDTSAPRILDPVEKLYMAMEKAGYFGNESGLLKNAVLLALANWAPKIADVLMQGPDGEKRLSDKDKTEMGQFIDQMVSDLIELHELRESPRRGPVDARRFKQSLQLFLKAYIQTQLNTAALRSKEEFQLLVRDVRMLDKQPVDKLNKLIEEVNHTISQIDETELTPLEQRIQLLKDEAQSEYTGVELAESDLQVFRNKAGSDNVRVESWPTGPENIHRNGIIGVAKNDKSLLICIPDKDSSTGEDTTWFAAIPIERVPGLNLQLVRDKLENGEPISTPDVLSTQQAIQYLEKLKASLEKKLVSLAKVSDLLEAICENKLSVSPVNPWSLPSVRMQLARVGPLDSREGISRLDGARESIFRHLPGIWSALRLDNNSYPAMQQFIESCVDAHEQTIQESIEAAGQELIGPTQQAESFSELTSRTLGYDSEADEVRTLAMSVWKASEGIVAAALTPEKGELSVEDSTALSDLVTKALNEIHSRVIRVLTIQSTQDAADLNLFSQPSTSFSPAYLKEKLTLEIQKLFENFLITKFTNVAKMHEAGISSVVQNIRIANEYPEALHESRAPLYSSMSGKLEEAMVMKKQYLSMEETLRQRPQTSKTAVAPGQAESAKGKEREYADTIANLKQREKIIRDGLRDSLGTAYLLRGISENAWSDRPKDPLSLPSTEEFMDNFLREQQADFQHLAGRVPALWQALKLNDVDLFRIQKFAEDKHREIQRMALEDAKNKPRLLRGEKDGPRTLFEAELQVNPSFHEDRLLLEDPSRDRSKPLLLIPTEVRRFSEISGNSGTKAIEYHSIQVDEDTNETREFREGLSPSDALNIKQITRSKTPELILWPATNEPIPERGICYVTDNNKWVIVEVLVTSKTLAAQSQIESLGSETTPIRSASPEAPDSESEWESESSVSDYVTSIDYYLVTTRRIPRLDPDLHPEETDEVRAKLLKNEPTGPYDVVAAHLEQDQDMPVQSPPTISQKPITVRLSNGTTIKCHRIQGGERVHSPLGTVPGYNALIMHVVQAPDSPDKFVMVIPPEFRGGVRTYNSLAGRIGQSTLAFSVKSKEEIEKLRKPKKADQSPTESVDKKRGESRGKGRGK